mgnify:CR=1 FL=1
MAKKNEIIVLDLKVNVDDTKKKLAEINQSIFQLRAETTEYRKKQREAFEAGNTASFEKLTAKISDNDSKIKSLSRTSSQYSSTLTKVDQLNNAAAGSYEQLLRQYELASVQLKIQEGTLKVNADGTRVLTEEYNKASEKVKSAKDAIDKFNKGIGDGRSSVGQYTEAIKTAFADQGLLSGQIGNLKNAFAVAKGGADLFKNGINGIGGALKVSGIGIFTSALQLLQGLLKSNDGLMDAFEQGTAALGAVFKGITGVIISFGKGLFEAISKPKVVFEAVVDYINGTVVQAFKALGNIVAGVFTLDFEQIKGGIDQYGGALKNAVQPAVDAAGATKEWAEGLAEAAKEAVNLAKRTQELEDRERAFKTAQEATKLQVDNLIKQAKERTDSEQERLRLLSQAAELEKTNLKESQAIQEERLSIILAENAEAEKRGQLTDELKDKQVEAETELVRIKGESAIKSQDIDNRAAQLTIAINKGIIQNKIDSLNAQLALQEANGKSTVELQKRIAAEERAILLEDAEGNAVKLQQIELDYQAKLINIRKKAEAERRALFEQTQDIELSLIRDANDREIAQLVVESQRKIAQIKATGEEEIALREAILLQLSDKIREVEQRRSAESLSKSQDRIEKTGEAELKAIERKFKEEEDLLNISASKKLISESDLQEKLLALRLSKAQEELEATQQVEAQKLLAFENSYNQELAANQKRYDDGIISQEAFNAAKLEIDQRYSLQRVTAQQDAASKIAESEIALNDVKVEAAIAGNQKILDDEKRLSEARQEILNKTVSAIGNSFDAVNQILSKDEASKKKNADLLKTLSIAQITLNMITEISGYWKGVGVDAGTTGNLYTSAASAALASLNTAAALARAGAAIGQVGKVKTFARGGFTGNGMFEKDNTGKRVAGVVHEKEYVAPQWMVEHPQLKPIIGSLEKIRLSGRVLPFADGGFTSQFITNTIQTTQNNLRESGSLEEIIKKVTIVASAEEITGVQATTSIIQNTAEI